MNAPATLPLPDSLRARLGLREACFPCPSAQLSRWQRWWGSAAVLPPAPELTLSRREGLYFLHLPKAGGTSFDSFLSGFFAHDEILPVRMRYSLPSEWPQEIWRNCRYFHSAHPYHQARHRFKPLHFVTLLRDPIRRILSLYWYLRTGFDYGLVFPEVLARHQSAWQNAKQASLAEWIHMPEARTASVAHDTGYYRNVMVRMLTAGRTQSKIGKRWMSNRLRQAKRILRDEFAFVGIVEDYARSKTLFCRTFGLPEHYAAGEEKLNVRSKSVSREPTDPTLLETLRRQNEYDIELYEFAKELLDLRESALTPRTIEPRRYSELTSDAPRAIAGRLEFHAGSLRGSGLYQEELRPDGGSHRWTGSLPQATIDFAARWSAATSLLVQLDLPAVIHAEAWTSLQLRCDGIEPVHCERRHEGPLLRLLATFPPAVASADTPLHQLQISSATGAPAPGPDGTADDRRLGVAIERLILEWHPTAELHDNARRVG